MTLPRWCACVVAMALTFGATTDLYAQCPDGSPLPCRAPPRAVAAAPSPNTLAVLFFDNLSRDTADAYLTDGLTEEIITQLGRIDRLTVKSRATVLRYRSAPDPVAAGRALRVAHLVYGSLRRAGQRLRVNVELTRVTSGDREWGEVYEGDAVDFLTIQENIAREVATAIAGRLRPTEVAFLTARMTRSPEAYDHYLRGNYYLAQRTARLVPRAIEEYEAAEHFDPQFTRALARTAYAYALSLYWGWDVFGLPAESLLARGLAADDQALRSDSANSDAWMARAYLSTFRFPHTYAGAGAAFARAIALDSLNAEAYHQYAGILAELGEDSASAAACHRALAIEPARPITLVQLADLYYAGGRFDTARRWLDSALAVDPTFQFAYAFRAAARLRLGEADGARGDAETALRLGSGLSVPAEAAGVLVATRGGDTADARARVERLARAIHPPDRPSSAAYWLATALVAVGDTGQAFDLLERLHPRGIRLWFYLRYPEFDPVRVQPRFQRLVEEPRPPGAPSQ